MCVHLHVQVCLVHVRARDDGYVSASASAFQALAATLPVTHEHFPSARESVPSPRRVNVKRILFTLYLVSLIKRISKSEPFVMKWSKQHFKKKNEVFRS